MSTPIHPRRGFWPNSLKTRVTLVTLAVFFLSIGSLFAYVEVVLRKSMTRRLGEQQLSTASMIATAINGEFDSRFDALRRAALVAAPLMHDPPALQAALERNQVLRLFFNGGVIATGPDGTAIADLPKSTGRTGVNYSGDAWVEAALREGRSTVGRPIMGKVLGVPVFPMTVPVFGRHGAVVGTLNGVVKLAKPNFLDAISQGGYGRTGGFLLIAPQYRLIVTASDGQRIMERLPAPGVNPTIDSTLAHKKGTYEFVNPRGVDVLSSSVQIPTSGWHVVVSLPTREAFAPIRNVQQRILLVTLLLALVAGGTTWWILRHQLTPLTVAVDTLHEFADTDRPLDTLPVTSRDEVGDLIAAFNQLLLTLRDREVALKESHEILGGILATTRDGYWRVDDQGHLLDVNETYLLESGYTREEILSMTIADLEVTETDDNVAGHIQKLLDTGSDLFESRHRRKDGSIWDVEVSAMYRDVEGGQFVAFIRNTTERKQLEAARLTSQKLESLGTLASGIAHDFNNILSAIMGNAELLAEDLEPEQDTARSVAEITRAAARASELVRRIMAFGRPGEATREVVELATVVDEVFHLLRPTVPAGISLTRVVADDTPHVVADVGQIHEVLVNLTTNATHAMGEQTGSIEFRLEAAQVDDDLALRIPGLEEGRYARLTVTDSGCGMDRATMSRIFDAFFTTKPQGEGVGLGLSMVHGIMKAHGGAVTVESAPGGGSSFALYLPAAEEEAGQEERPAEVRAPTSPSLRMLYVDDEPALTALAERMLRHMGHEVTGFTNPDAALEAFRTRPRDFDVVVTDLSMPSMSGFDVARSVLAIRPTVAVVLTTGAPLGSDEETARRIGILEILHKPARMDEWRQVLEQIAARETPRSPSTEAK